MAETGRTLPRRDMLRKGAIAGGLIWAAPAIRSVDRAFAQGTESPDGGGGGGGGGTTTTIGWQLTISGNTNVPTFRIDNISEAASGAQITSFTMTIGDTTYNYDSANESSQSGGITGTRVTPDGNTGGGVRSDAVEYTFTGFDPGGFFSFTADVDIDDSDTVEDYQTVLFNNGADPNSTVTVEFSTGQTLVDTWPETPTGPPYVLSETQAI